MKRNMWIGITILAISYSEIVFTMLPSGYPYNSQQPTGSQYPIGTQGSQPQYSQPTTYGPQYGGSNPYPTSFGNQTNSSQNHIPSLSTSSIPAPSATSTSFSGLSLGSSTSAYPYNASNTYQTGPSSYAAPSAYQAGVQSSVSSISASSNPSYSMSTPGSSGYAQSSPTTPPAISTRPGPPPLNITTPRPSLGSSTPAYPYNASSTYRAGPSSYATQSAYQAGGSYGSGLQSSGSSSLTSSYSNPTINSSRTTQASATRTSLPPPPPLNLSGYSVSIRGSTSSAALPPPPPPLAKSSIGLPAEAHSAIFEALKSAYKQNKISDVLSKTNELFGTEEKTISTVRSLSLSQISDAIVWIRSIISSNPPEIKDKEAEMRRIIGYIHSAQSSVYAEKTMSELQQLFEENLFSRTEEQCRVLLSLTNISSTLQHFSEEQILKIIGFKQASEYNQTFSQSYDKVRSEELLTISYSDPHKSKIKKYYKLKDFSAADFEKLEKEGKFADALNEIAHFLSNNVRCKKIENLRPIIQCYKRCLDEVKKQIRAIKAVDVQSMYFNPDGTGKENFMKLPAMERAYLRTLAVRYKYSEKVTSSSSAAASSAPSDQVRALIAPLFCEQYNDGEIYDFESRQQALDELNLPLDEEVDLRTQCTFELTKQEKSKDGLPAYDEREIEILKPLVNDEGSLSILSQTLRAKGKIACVAQGAFLYMRANAQRCRLFLQFRDCFEKYIGFDRAEEYLARGYNECDPNGEGPNDYSHDVVIEDKFLDQQINRYRECIGFGAYNYGMHAHKDFMEKIDKSINKMRELIYKLSLHFYDHLGQVSEFSRSINDGYLKELFAVSGPESALIGFPSDPKMLPTQHSTIYRAYLLGFYGDHPLNAEEEKLALYLKRFREDLNGISQWFLAFGHAQMKFKIILSNDLFSQLKKSVMSRKTADISQNIANFFDGNANPTENFEKLSQKNQGVARLITAMYYARLMEGNLAGIEKLSAKLSAILAPIFVDFEPSIQSEIFSEFDPDVEVMARLIFAENLSPINLVSNPLTDSERDATSLVLDRNEIARRWSNITHDVLSPLLNTTDGKFSKGVNDFLHNNPTQADTIRGHIAALMLINSGWRECAILGKLFFGESKIETSDPLDFGFYRERQIPTPLTITPLFKSIINTPLGEAVLRSYLQKYCFSSAYFKEEDVWEEQEIESSSLVDNTSSNSSSGLFKQVFPVIPTMTIRPRKLVRKKIEYPGTGVDCYQEPQIEQLLISNEETDPEQKIIPISNVDRFIVSRYESGVREIRLGRRNRKDKLRNQSKEFQKKLDHAKKFVESLLLSLPDDSINTLAEPISRILKLQSLFQTALGSIYDWKIEKESYLQSDNALMCKAVREFLLLRTGYRDYKEHQFREESLIASSPENVRIFENLMKYYEFSIKNSQTASSKSEIQTQLEQEEKQLEEEKKKSLPLSISLDVRRSKIETKKTIYGLDSIGYSHATDLYLALPLQYKSQWMVVLYDELSIRLSFRNKLLMEYGLFPWDYGNKLVFLDCLMYGFDPSASEKDVELKAYKEYLKKHPEEAEEINGDPKASKTDIFVREKTETSSSSAEQSLPDPVLNRYLQKRLERLSREASDHDSTLRDYLDSLIFEKESELNSERRETEAMMLEDERAHQKRQEEIEEEQRRLEEQHAQEIADQEKQRGQSVTVAVPKTEEEKEQFIREKIKEHKKERRSDWFQVWKQEAQEIGMSLLDYYNERYRIYQLMQQELHQFIRDQITQRKAERRNDWLQVWKEDAQRFDMELPEYFDELTKVLKMIKAEEAGAPSEE